MDMFRNLSFALLLVVLLTACAPSATSTSTALSTELTFTDDLGRVVSLPAPAQSIVSMAPSNTEVLFAVGAGSQVVGRDLFSDYPTEAVSVQDIGGSWGEYNLEAILALQPDLVLAQGGGFNPPELIASLEDLGLTVFVLPNPTTLEEMYANLETVGALTGHSSEAAALVESLTARVAAVDAAILPISYQPSVYYELDASNPASPYTAGAGTFVDQLISRAGGYNIGSALEGLWTPISMEDLLVADPTIILLGDAAYGETPEKVSARPGWDALIAIQNGQVFAFDDNLVSRPGPRLVDGLEALVEILHPGLLK
jgi:iron complex transport system substrate-binding protein